MFVYKIFFLIFLVSKKLYRKYLSRTKPQLVSPSLIVLDFREKSAKNFYVKKFFEHKIYKFCSFFWDCWRDVIEAESTTMVGSRF